MIQRCIQHITKGKMLWLKGRLIRTLKNKIYKYIASALKNVYTDILADIQMFHKK